MQNSNNMGQIILIALPIIILQLGVQIYAIFDLVKRKKTKNLSMGAWLVIVILGELIGAVLYFLVGRSDE